MRNIEREFGVPLAGEILEPPLWSQTALKRLPPGPLDFEAIFGRKAPLVVDLGCGNGRYLIGSAIWRPNFDHLGIDILPLVLRYASRRGNQRGIKNLRFAAVDGLTLIRDYLGPASVRELHIYHPQPFHDVREASKRLINPPFLQRVHEVLEPDGLLYVQTDNEPYWDYMKGVLPAIADMQEQPRAWPDAPKGRTRREIIALRRRMPIYRAWGKRRDLPLELTNLEWPIFDAGPRNRELDALEG